MVTYAQRETDLTISGESHADSRATPEPWRPGTVYLVGAGPGDPDLITRKGLRLLRAADVVVYDRLIAPELLDEARPDAELIFVGKGPGCHTMPQEDINRLLVAHGRRGRAVVRLKGGDPFVFGRGGEEAEALVAAGVPFEVVPGVSSAVAVPAYAGIPVTHRGHAPLMTVVTGHEGEGSSESPPVDWDALAKLGGTVVIMMGLSALPRLTRRLIEGGMAPETPAAVIAQGTTQRQRVVTGTLADIATRAAAERVQSPAITVVGAVAGLSERLAWFEAAPLAWKE